MASTGAVGAAGPPILGIGGRAPGRPGYWRVLRGVLYGQFVGSVGLYGLCLALALARLRLGFTGDAVYRPWPVAGAWSLAADLGWGVLVAALLGTAVKVGVERRTGVTLARGWCVVAVALGGYGSLVVAQTSQAELVLAILFTPALVCGLAFDAAGGARPFPGAIGWHGRRARLLAALALVLVLPYGVLHPLVADGSGTVSPPSPTGGWSGSSSDSDSGDVYSVAPGQPVRALSGIHGGPFGLTVTGVRLAGVPADLRTLGLSVAPDGPGPPLGTGAPAAHGLPLALHPGGMIWITYSVALARCSASGVRVDRMLLSYRAFGLALTQVVRLQRATVLTCGRPGG
jgi:hypothetical protein